MTQRQTQVWKEWVILPANQSLGYIRVTCINSEFSRHLLSDKLKFFAMSLQAKNRRVTPFTSLLMPHHCTRALDAH